MPEKDPNNYEWLAYSWPVLVAMLGGLVKFLNNLKDTSLTWFTLFELTKTLITSGFVGLVTYWACQYGDIDNRLSAILIAISGHMGVLAINEFEKMVKVWINGLLNAKSAQTRTPQVIIDEENEVKND